MARAPRNSVCANVGGQRVTMLNCELGGHKGPFEIYRTPEGFSCSKHLPAGFALRNGDSLEIHHPSIGWPD